MLPEEREPREGRLSRGLAGMFRRERMDGSALLRQVREVVPLDAPYTPAHPPKVATVCRTILDAIDVEPSESDLIVAASRIHDLSRTRLPDWFAGLSGTLAASDALESLRPEMARRFPAFVRGLEMVRWHHERWDGRGYPDGLAGDAIPLGARVIGVADAYISLITDRPYRRSLPIDTALQTLRTDAGCRWDPEIVSAWLSVLPDGMERRAIRA